MATRLNQKLFRVGWIKYSCLLEQLWAAAVILLWSAQISPLLLDQLPLGVDSSSCRLCSYLLLPLFVQAVTRQLPLLYAWHHCPSAIVRSTNQCTQQHFCPKNWTSTELWLLASEPLCSWVSDPLCSRSGMFSRFILYSTPAVQQPKHICCCRPGLSLMAYSVLYQMQ